MSDSDRRMENSVLSPEDQSDDDIEIVEVVGLDEDSPGATAVEDDGDLVLDLDEAPPAGPAQPEPPASADTERLIRLRAEFDNLERRVERERADFREQANADLIIRLLPVLDNFERGLASGMQAGDVESLRDGIVLIFRQLLDELRKEGLEAIEAVGETFDPEVHEAVETDEDSSLPPHTVTEELQRGYRMNGKLLRPSLVKVKVDPTDGRGNP